MREVCRTPDCYMYREGSEALQQAHAAPTACLKPLTFCTVLCLLQQRMKELIDSMTTQHHTCPCQCTLGCRSSSLTFHSENKIDRWALAVAFAAAPVLRQLRLKAQNDEAVPA
jgi:hypothetical protein